MQAVIKEIYAIWPKLYAATGGKIAIVGGFGLYLQQHYLKELYLSESPPALPLLVPFREWGAPDARTTDDLDVIVELDVISSAEMQKDIAGIMDIGGFSHFKDGDKCWRFSKQTPDNALVFKTEFLAEEPPAKVPGLRSDARRVKPAPSLQTGIHGRTTPESSLWYEKASVFVYAGIEFKTPNAASWLCMKIKATHDSLEKSRMESSSAGRENFEKLSKKHAKDCYRIAAMLDRARYLQALEVAGRLSESKSAARKIFRETFLPAGIIRAACAGDWQPESFRFLNETIGKIVGD